MWKSVDRIARKLVLRCRRKQSGSHTTPSHDSGESSDSKVKSFARAVIRTLEATVGVPKVPKAEKTADAPNPTDQSAKQSSTSPSSPSYGSSDEHQDRERRLRTNASLAQVHSVNEEFDKELAALASLRVEALRHLNGPLGKERDPDGYVTIRNYQPFVRHRLVKIETLPYADQNRHYENALYGATTSQAREQYDLHCQRLETIRNNISKTQQVPKRERRLGNIDYEAWYCMTSRLMMNRLLAMTDRAWRALVEADEWFETRLWAKIEESGVIRLLERCEGILKNADQGFIAKSWRPMRRGLKKSRWVDGKRGWAGLQQGDIS